MINGSFAVIVIQGKFLFLKRKDRGLWDLPGGGFEASEIDYKGVVKRETEEGAGLIIPREKFHLFGMLGQRLKKEVSEIYKVTRGFVFLHKVTLYEMPKIIPGDEHSEWRLFTYEEIMSEWEDFSSGPLWQLFTFLSFQETNEFQEGLIFDRRMWQGKEYYKPL